MAEQLFKTVEIDGETYMIRKFTAITGLQIARLIISKMAPIIPALSAAQSDALDALAKNVELLSQCLDSISDDEIAALARKCLKVCIRPASTRTAPTASRGLNITSRSRCASASKPFRGVRPIFSPQAAWVRS